MKKLLFFSVFAILMACSTVKTAYDCDPQTDFTKYKTFNFTKYDLVASVGELNSNRIFKAAENELILKGFTKSENPDFLVDIYLKAVTKLEVTATTTSPYGYGRYGYASSYNSTTRINYDEYTEGSLFISVVDNSTQVIVWQGVGTKIVDEEAGAEKREKMIDYSVAQILKNYPPQKKK